MYYYSLITISGSHPALSISLFCLHFSVKPAHRHSSRSKLSGCVNWILTVATNRSGSKTAISPRLDRKGQIWVTWYMAGSELITLHNTPSPIIIYRKETDSETNRKLLKNARSASNLSKCWKHQADFKLGMRKMRWSGNNPVKGSRITLVLRVHLFWDMIAMSSRSLDRPIDVLFKSYEDKDFWYMDMYILYSSKACLQQE